MKDPQQSVAEKTLSLATGSVSPPPEAQCVFADFGSLVSSVNSVMGMSFGDGGSFIESPLQSPPTAPSHHLSMHQKGLQTDKYYIYNMNIYSNFNGLLMDFFVHLEF